MGLELGGLRNRHEAEITNYTNIVICGRIGHYRMDLFAGQFSSMGSDNFRSLIEVLVSNIIITRSNWMEIFPSSSEKPRHVQLTLPLVVLPKLKLNIEHIYNIRRLYMHVM